MEKPKPPEKIPQSVRGEPGIRGGVMTSRGQGRVVGMELMSRPGHINMHRPEIVLRHEYEQTKLQGQVPVAVTESASMMSLSAAPTNQQRASGPAPAMNLDISSPGPSSGSRGRGSPRVNRGKVGSNKRPSTTDPGSEKKE